MKRKINEAYFKSTDIQKIDIDLPLNLKNLEPIIGAIAKKYPLLKKSEISLIIRRFMEEIRDQLLQGNAVNIYDFLLNMRLYTYCKLQQNKLAFNAKIQVNTPQRIKNLNVIK